MADQNPEEDRFRMLARSIATCDIEEFIHPKKGGSFNFEKDRRLLEAIIKFYADVASASFEATPANILQRSVQMTEALISRMEYLQRFDFSASDPNQTLQRVSVELRNQWHDAYIQITPHLALAKVSSAAISLEVQVLKNTTAAIQANSDRASEAYTAKAKAAEQQLEERIAQLDNVLSAAREASAIKAVSAQASEFEVEAVRCLESAGNWFKATIGVVAISLIVIWWMFIKDFQRPVSVVSSKGIPAAFAGTNVNVLGEPAQKSMQVQSQSTDEARGIAAELFQQAVARILIVTLLYSAVLWCARNYFACRHNYTVNRHRRNAMQTFRAFVEGTKDPATQDFVLRQAAACAFAPQQTGYLKDESLPTPAPASQIIDVVKSGGGKD